LEFRDGRCGVRSEDAIDPTGIEAQSAKAELEIGYVVTAEHWRVEVEVAIA
jgi:hypothetical protein